MRITAGKGLALLLSGMLVGCSTTHTVLREQRQVARIQVESVPAGAAIYIDRQARGRTPGEVQLTYTRIDKELHPAERKQGWWLLGTGLATMITGIGVGIWGFSDIGNTDAEPAEKVGKTVAGTYAVLGAIYGLTGLIAGIYYLSKSPASIPVTEVTPARVAFSLNVPGVGLQQAVLSPVAQALPRQGPPGQVRFSSVGWEARLPGGLQLVGSSGPQTRIAVGPAPAGTHPPLALPAPPDDSPSPAARVEALREQGEACYRKRDYACALQRFERAFALLPTPSMRFNLASALDKVGRAALAIRQYRLYLKESGGAASPSALAHIQKRMKTLLPQVCQLELVVEPADATVTLDGVPLASLETVPSSGGRHQLVLEAGSYRLDLSSRGHQTRMVNVKLAAGDLRTLEVKLDRLSGREDEP